MKLPLLISVPHAGLAVPEEVAERSILTPEQIAKLSFSHTGQFLARMLGESRQLKSA